VSRPLTLVLALLALAGGCGSDDHNRLDETPAGTGAEISTAGCKPEETAQRYPGIAGRTVKIATSPITPPFVFTEAKDRRKLVGFDVDFAEAWAKCLGLKYEWQSYQEVPAMIAAVQGGRADVVHAELFHNPDRAKQIDFVIYMKTFTGSLVPKGNPKQLESIDDLCGKSDAQALGTVEVALVKGQSVKCRKAGKPPVKLVVYRDNNVAIQAVVTGRVDAFLSDVVLVGRIARRFPDRIETAFNLDNSLNIGLGVNKQQTELRDAILAATKAIQKNGTETRLLRKWELQETLLVPAFHPQ
jgi:polar amino acid transport system substrate-binding protein